MIGCMRQDIRRLRQRRRSQPFDLAHVEGRSALQRSTIAVAAILLTVTATIAFPVATQASANRPSVNF